MREAILRFIARSHQYAMMPAVQLIHHQAEQRDVINSETALTETTVNGKVYVLSVEAADTPAEWIRIPRAWALLLVRSRPCKRILYLRLREPMPVRAKRPRLDTLLPCLLLNTGFASMLPLPQICMQ